MKSAQFRYEEKAGVARVRLDRPETLNSLTFDGYRDLTALFRGLPARPDLRVGSFPMCRKRHAAAPCPFCRQSRPMIRHCPGRRHHSRSGGGPQARICASLWRARSDFG